MIHHGDTERIKKYGEKNISHKGVKKGESTIYPGIFADVCFLPTGTRGKTKLQVKNTE